MSYDSTPQTYRKWNPAIWSDPRFSKLSGLAPSAQALLMFLCLCREGQLIPGVVLLGIAAIAEILSWAVDAAKAALDELVSAEEVMADLSARLIFVFRGLEMNPPSNPNVVTSWSRTWHDIPWCDLKATIRGCLESLLRDRGPSFLEAFQKACPEMPRNHSGNRFLVGMANGLDNQDPGTGSRNQDHEPNQDPESGLQALAGPGGLAGDAPCRDQFLAGEKQGFGSGPGSAMKASRPGVPLTIDDIVDELDSPWVPSKTQRAEVESTENETEIPRELAPAMAVIEAWNTQVAPKNPLFEQVIGKQAEALLPRLMEVLQDPLAASEFEDLFKVIPLDPFYAQQNETGFKAFLAYYVKMTPEKRKYVVGIARNKLASMTRGGGKPSHAPKSAKQAANLRAAQARSGQNTSTDLSNDIYNQAVIRPKEA